KAVLSLFYSRKSVIGMTTPSMNDKRYKIITFGCQMNLADYGSLAALLNARGYTPVDTEIEAGIIILNTCSVREKAEERVWGRLGELSFFKKNNPAKRIAFVGCMAQRLGDKILDRAPFVDFVMGTEAIFRLPQFLENELGMPNVNVEIGYEENGDQLPSRDTKYSAYITISRGCSHFCTYCIVPYVRGHERSYPMADIIRRVNAFVDDGVLEITLLGQNVNSYHDGRFDFSDLIRAVAKETDIRRIRFMTSHPRNLSERLIETMASEPRVMTHLHLPLQSGSNRILEKMGRAYTYDHYGELVKKLKVAIPEIALTTDLIVGFPSETEGEYQMTLEAVRAIRFDSSFMFHYSPREGTKAAMLDDDILEKEKIRRLIDLINIQKKVSFERNQLELGRIRSVLVDGFSRRSGKILKGKTEGNKTILFESDRKIIGTIQKIRVTAADSWTLHGEIVESSNV
ncbi:MAG: tRNA (N6-isopentenyl adenosine(37)-C2)-methylthiotransferase MiaB, partial [candidate division Zixibacteria bacterium]|nr:tRNA (N6-isopentenyl adenosine(37)-C2)-methylthiotransferase MiaB [candidate division Zixibacteria bacterium]